MHDIKTIKTEDLEAELVRRKIAVVAEQGPDIATVYYRSKDRKLHAFKTHLTSPKEAIQAVMEELHIEKEVFLKPVLYVVDGKPSPSPKEAA